MALMTVIPSGTSTFLPEISIVTRRGFKTSGWSMMFWLSVVSVAIVLLCEALMSDRGCDHSSLVMVLGDRVDDPVQRGAGAHRPRRLLIVRMIIPANILRLALGGQQLLIDLRGIVAQLLGNLRELFCGFLVGCLCRQGLRPVQRQVKMAAAIVDFPDLAGGRLVALEELCVGLIQRIRKDLGHLIVPDLSQVFERCRECQKFAEGVPPQ